VVPGSISNLGPAFDALSVAVTVYLRLHVTGVRLSEPGSLDMEFPAGAPPGENRIEQGFRRAEAHFGDRAPGLRVKVESEIPMRAGLGSSAAATVAGMRLYEAFTAPRDPGDLLALATEIEGHPDNAAACLYGGLTIAWADASGPRAARLDTVPGLCATVFVPAGELATATARGLLPPSVPHADAAHSAGRAALLVAALTSRPDLLVPATEDRLHQSYRAGAMPGTAALVADLRSRGVAAVVSGAGPSVLALRAEGEPVPAVDAADGWTVLDLQVSHDGARVGPGPL
jgi:homoserine kinase